MQFKLLPDGMLQVIGSYFTIRDFNNMDFGIRLDPAAGDDGYFFPVGTTTLRIANGSGNDTLVFREGITAGDIDPQLQDGHLRIVVDGAQIVINDWAANVIERFVFSDGMWLGTTEFAGLIKHAPTVIDPFADQTTDEDSLFTIDLSGRFADPDAGDLLSLAVIDPATGQLPGWLSFDPATHVLSGTPLNDAVGSIDLQVTATDAGGLTVADTFTLTVNNINDALVAVPDTAALTLLAESANPGLTPAPEFRVTTDAIPGYNHSLARLAGGGYFPVRHEPLTTRQ